MVLIIFRVLTYSRKARDTCVENFGNIKSAMVDCRPLTIVGKIDLERSKSEANDCNKNAKNANDATTLIGSKVLKCTRFIMRLHVLLIFVTTGGLRLTTIDRLNYGTLTDNKLVMRINQIHCDNCVQDLIVACHNLENLHKVETICSSTPSCTYPTNNTEADFCRMILDL